MLSMILSLLYSNTAYAETNTDIITSILDYEVDAEEIDEAKADALSSDGNMGWYTATKVDKLPWNYFHNQVENEIRKKYAKHGIGQSELTIKLRYSRDDEKNNLGKEGELTGKIGKADLYWDYTSTITYLWEVKPISYASGTKKELGEEQLENIGYQIQNLKKVNI